MLVRERKPIKARLPISRLINEEYIALNIPRPDDEESIDDNCEGFGTISTPVSDNVKPPNFFSETKSLPKKRILSNRQPEESNNNKIVRYILPSLFIFVVITSLVFIIFQSNSKVMVNGIDLFHEVKVLKSKYHNQWPEIWQTFVSSIDDTIENRFPTIIVLTYSDNGQTARKLARNLVNVSSLALEAKETSLLEVYPKDLSPSYFEDQGRLITKYRTPLRDHTAIIFHDLHEMPGKVAQALHPFCDEITPLVDKAVIIFTMKINGSFDKYNLSSAVENNLTELWKNDIDKDILKALVIRIVSSAFHVFPENST